MGTKLHQLLAVEMDLRGIATKVLAETASLFGKSAAFSGSVRTFKPFAEEDAHLATEERDEVTTTVPARLKYTLKKVVPFWDVMFRKDVANQEAKADIIIGDKTIAADVPATTLLGLEKRLTELREAIANIPTLDAKIAWTPAADVGEDIWKAVHPETQFRTTKTAKPVVMYDAVVKDGVGIPAQVIRVDEDIRIGVTTTARFSGAVTSAEASKILERIDTLLVAVKDARQRANNVEIGDVKIGQKLADFILGD